MIDYSTRQRIAQQALNEISFARDAKSFVLPKWQRIDKMYLGIKTMLEWMRRNNINLNESQSFVQTFLSKINTPYNFKFIKGEEADLETAKVANAIKDRDAKFGNWNGKIRRARKELVKYGRYIMEYHADSIEWYNSHLSNVPVYQFLIDPSVGWDDIEKAFYLWRGNIIKSNKQIKEGIKKGIYLRTEWQSLIDGTGNASFQSKEDIAQNMWVTLAQKKTIQNPDQYKFWEWYTTYEDERYYLLVTEDGGTAIRIEKLSDIFTSDKYPFFTASSDDDLTEFWNPGPLEWVIEPIIAKSISINQFLDNAEAINRPMKAFNVNAVENPALLEYRPDGLIPVKNGFDAQKDIQFFQTVALNPAMTVYDKLDEIVSVQSGVTNGARGQSDEDKVGIYEGNQANAADRFSLVQDSEAEAQYRFATLWLEWLDEHMTKTVAVQMIGADGVQYEKKVTKADLKRGANYDITIITAGTEQTMQWVEKKNKLTFLQTNKINPIYNPKVMAEMEASIAGFNADEIKSMLDKEYGNAELMAEAAEDIQDILKNKKVKPNPAANPAYAQKILDYVKDNSEDLEDDQVARFYAYIDELMPIILYNMGNSINDQLAKEWLPSQQGLAQGMTGQADTTALMWALWGTQAQSLWATPQPSAMNAPQEPVAFQ